MRPLNDYMPHMAESSGRFFLTGRTKTAAIIAGVLLLFLFFYFLIPPYAHYRKIKKELAGHFNTVEMSKKEIDAILTRSQDLIRNQPYSFQSHAKDIAALIAAISERLVLPSADDKPATMSLYRWRVEQLPLYQSRSQLAVALNADTKELHDEIKSSIEEKRNFNLRLTNVMALSRDGFHSEIISAADNAAKALRNAEKEVEHKAALKKQIECKQSKETRELCIREGYNPDTGRPYNTQDEHAKAMNALEKRLAAEKQRECTRNRAAREQCIRDGYNPSTGMRYSPEEHLKAMDALN